ncbi:Rpp14/Pop5 family-domain-containing protein [Kockovaella imperatae]|uniref:Rpp14/Pop5 family-domain-containing protein n=1 Tax=Kockovaella imperatae TaxID=4999 RepID=A0A1Y1U8C6_9TREE|nr:Rpp14/Pop5 family-domain-containing protein [Kockovaella imperatae]ORX34262.1 Rpp14/Pop5 family-domain-containing protein [Kockovaella imperatae]
MVRFKNRHILVEFLQPSTLSPTFNGSASKPKAQQFSGHSESPQGQLVNEGSDDEDEVNQALLQPSLPFMLPLPSVDGTKPRLHLGDEGGSVIYRAIKGSIQEVYGDEGWGRVASSFKVVYHSPLTTLTMLRIARQHYRLLWSAITFLTSVQGQDVLPRVVAVSGTIKKVQNTAIVYHRRVTARMLAVALEQEAGLVRSERERQLEAAWNNERKMIEMLDD